MTFEKKNLTYEQLLSFCGQIRREIRNNNDEYTEIVAVSRGGLTPAHILAKMLHLDVGMYSSKRNDLLLNNDVRPESKLLVVEDLVAKGRTFAEVNEFFARYSDVIGFDIDYDFAPILIDSEYDHTQFKYYGFRSNEWVVFPYEDFEAVTAGDRGLFRDGTDNYGKQDDTGC